MTLVTMVDRAHPVLLGLPESLASLDSLEFKDELAPRAALATLALPVFQVNLAREDSLEPRARKALKDSLVPRATEVIRVLKASAVCQDKMDEMG